MKPQLTLTGQSSQIHLPLLAIPVGKTCEWLQHADMYQLHWLIHIPSPLTCPWHVHSQCADDTVNPIYLQSARVSVDYIHFWNRVLHECVKTPCVHRYVDIRLLLQEEEDMQSKPGCPRCISNAI